MVVGQQRRAQPGVNVEVQVDITEYIALLCAMCKRFPNEPVQTPRGHRMCKDCFIVHAHFRENVCNDCLEENVAEDNCIKLAAFYPDKGSKLDVDKIQARCLNCNLVTSMKDMENHLKYC